MSHFYPLVLGCFLLCLSAVSADDKMWVRSIMHKDGTRTLSRQDNSINELQEVTFDRKNILVVRKIFRIDAIGRALSGQVYDGSNELLGRYEYGFDSYGRMIEERMFNDRQQVVRRMLYSYDSQGKQKRPDAFTFDPGKPNAKPRRVDPDSVPRSIATPNINGGSLANGDVIREGDNLPNGYQAAPAVTTRAAPAPSGGASQPGTTAGSIPVRQKAGGRTNPR